MHCTLLFACRWLRFLPTPPVHNSPPRCSWYRPYSAVPSPSPRTGQNRNFAAVSPSPEPFSNMALSLGEDVTAIKFSLAWIATHHPFVGAGLVIAFLVVIVLAVRCNLV